MKETKVLRTLTHQHFSRHFTQDSSICQIRTVLGRFPTKLLDLRNSTTDSGFFRSDWTSFLILRPDDIP
ncbi:unnamed protein product [Wuchereria bancrofti]|uniref:Uncharacterized protein n=1 Tax=Wuchereria bancrofti TaxID=6293 RepID=A0A3P7EA97_WUCBA|nr:unnamed protein product [Wuchereria bancrofti]